MYFIFLKCLYMKVGTFCDVSLAVEGVSLKCHKIILAAFSPYFHSVLLETTCQHPLVFLEVRVLHYCLPFSSSNNCYFSGCFTRTSQGPAELHVMLSSKPLFSLLWEPIWEPFWNNFGCSRGLLGAFQRHPRDIPEAS